MMMIVARGTNWLSEGVGWCEANWERELCRRQETELELDRTCQGSSKGRRGSKLADQFEFAANRTSTRQFAVQRVQSEQRQRRSSRHSPTNYSNSMGGVGLFVEGNYSSTQFITDTMMI